MHRVLFALVLLSACAPVRPGDDDDASCTTGLQVCALYSGQPADGYAQVRATPSDQPIESPLDADGCVVFDASPGTWEWSARHATDTCESVFEQVEVTECEVTTVSVELIEWCFDGR